MEKAIEPNRGKNPKLTCKACGKKSIKVVTKPQDFEHMKQNQLARALKRDPKTIVRWCKEGLPRNPDGKTISLHVAMLWLLERERQRTMNHFLNYARMCQEDMDFIIHVKQVNRKWGQTRKDLIESKVEKESEDVQESE